ncbi:hypothetical protein ACFWWB_08185 [Streptomyces sp. NPDC058690]|uniref:hypothetical protein n=1 Tax=Streptomyces sp. NPDC058690 TaxID=3346600 RepID=UPI003649625A
MERSFCRDLGRFALPGVILIVLGADVVRIGRLGGPLLGRRREGYDERRPGSVTDP